MPHGRGIRAHTDVFTACLNNNADSCLGVHGRRFLSSTIMVFLVTLKVNGTAVIMFSKTDINYPALAERVLLTTTGYKVSLACWQKSVPGYDEFHSSKYSPKQAAL